jgi:isopentenyl-diphosphate Delta-isomerase
MDNLPKWNRSLSLKELHIKCCIENDVESCIKTGFGEYYLVNEALTDIALDDIDTTCEFLGKRISTPFVISPITGGIKIARTINQNLAKAAQELNIAMSVGSEKLALEDPSLISTYQVRSVAPTIPLLANVGAVYLNYGYDIEECKRAVDIIQADALILYLNPLQKALQGTGQTNFRDLGKKIARICKGLNVPVIVKEVGFGISRSTAMAMRDAGVWAVDIAGAGGTSWAKIEKFIKKENYEEGIEPFDSTFDQWGIPTAISLVEVVDALKGIPIIASGGIRTGIDMAKAIALGASFVGLALPLLLPAMDSSEAVKNKIDSIIQDFKIAMFCCGKRTVSDFRTGNCIRKLSK